MISDTMPKLMLLRGRWSVPNKGRNELGIKPIRFIDVLLNAENCLLVEGVTVSNVVIDPVVRLSKNQCPRAIGRRIVIGANPRFKHRRKVAVSSRTCR